MKQKGAAAARKFICMLLAAVLLAGMLPSGVLAEEAAQSTYVDTDSTDAGSTASQPEMDEIAQPQHVAAEKRSAWTVQVTWDPVDQADGYYAVSYTHLHRAEPYSAPLRYFFAFFPLT